jgi:hypothetical protein
MDLVADERQHVLDRLADARKARIGSEDWLRRQKEMTATVLCPTESIV